MLKHLLNYLCLDKDFSLTEEEIADILWLTSKRWEFSETNKNVEHNHSQRENNSFSPQDDIASTQSESAHFSSSTEVSKEQPYANVERSSPSTTARTLSITLPDAPSFPQPLTLVRALKPLSCRIKLGVKNILDEVCTAEQTALATTNPQKLLISPVLKAKSELRFDLALVIEKSTYIGIWQQTLLELKSIVERYGIFRVVKTWCLVKEADQIVLYKNFLKDSRTQKPINSNQLTDPSGRTLIWVVTDCTSSLWYGGTIFPLLKKWAKNSPVAILQMLPPWLWQRSALRRGAFVSFASNEIGIPNPQLKVTELLIWKDIDFEKGIKLPTFTLERETIKEYSLVIKGNHQANISGFIFPLDLNNTEQSSQKKEVTYDTFRLTASPLAQKLAALLAAAPVITLPIVRILQEQMLPDSNPVHVAEVFLGGLVKPLFETNSDLNQINSDPNQVEYQFINEENRKHFLEISPVSETVEVINIISRWLSDKIGINSQKEFKAQLKNPKQVKQEHHPLIGHFAKITAEILQELGSQYAEYAHDLKKSWGSDADSSRNNLQVNPEKPGIEKNYHFLGQQSNTKFYSICTDKPWLLPFDAFVIPVGQRLGFGELAQSFKYFLGENFIFIDELINKAKSERKEFIISPNEPLLIALPSEINNQLFPSDKNTQRFIICATVQDRKPSAVNAGKAAESVIRMTAVLGLKRIVLPLLGTGINNLPVDKVVFEILLSISKCLNHLSSNTITEILLVDNEESQIKIITQVAHTLLDSKNSKGVNYTQLLDLLIKRKWKEADRETANIMLKAANQEQRGYLEAVDLEHLPSDVLKKLDKLWVNSSQERFGFSVQKAIWLSLGGQSGQEDNEIYKQFGERVGWYNRQRDSWLLWDEHTFSLDAPLGHLPRSLPSQAQKIRPYLFSRTDLVIPAHVMPVTISMKNQVKLNVKTQVRGIDLGIIVALREEFMELYGQLPSPQAIFDNETGVTDYLFELGQSLTYRCAATLVGDMGLERAALATERFIKRCQPKTIVMLGIAGGINKDVKLGDVVVVTTANNYLYRAKAVPGEGETFTFERGGDYYRSSEDLVQAIQNLKFHHNSLYQKWQNEAKARREAELPSIVLPTEFLRENPEFIKGAIASGPVVGAAQEFTEWLKKGNRNSLAFGSLAEALAVGAAQKFTEWLKEGNRNSLALEMEGGGMLSAICSHTDPKKTLILRGISDFADERKQELDAIGGGEIRRYAMNNAIQLLWKLLEAGILPKNTDIPQPTPTEELLVKLKALIQMQGEIYEGKDGDHGNFFGTGDTYESTTWPREVQIIPTGDKEGQIRVPYDCMVRHKHYIAQAETATQDHQHPAIITARYSIEANTASNVVHISAINFEGHQARRCGNSIRARLESINGKTLN